MARNRTLFEYGLRIKGQSQLTDFYPLYASELPPRMEDTQ